MKRLEIIKELEKKALQLDPNPEQKAAWNSKVHEYAQNYLSTLDSSKVYRGANDESHPFDLNEAPIILQDLLEEQEKFIDSQGINAAAGGHMGYIPGGGLYPSAMGDFIAAVTNSYAGVYYASPGAVQLENALISWMCRLVGYPKSAVGNLTSGGSISNLIAVVTAREAQGLKAKDFSNSVVYLSTQAHHSVQKALRIAGLGESILRYIPLDENLRLDVKKLEEFIENDLTSGLIPFMINASFGTTNTGAIDPIEEISKLAEKHKIWFHVDAAYGGFFKLCPELESKYKGLELADSITLDPHKTLFLPFGSGAVLIKNKMALLAVHHYLADYLQDAQGANDQLSPADLSPELTKHFRGLRLWFPLKLFGIGAFRSALSEKYHLAQYFYSEAQNISHLSLGPTPDLSIVLFRVSSGNEQTRKLLKIIQDDGRVYLSSTSISEVFWIRVAVVHFRTHLKHIETLLNLLKQNFV